MTITQKDLKELAYDPKHGATIACVACKSPLWHIEVGEKYGSRWQAVKRPYEGVPPYEEYWAKDQKTALRTDCPKCGKDYFKAVAVDVPGGVMVVPKFFVPEFE